MGQWECERRKWSNYFTRNFQMMSSTECKLLEWISFDSTGMIPTREQVVDERCFSGSSTPLTEVYVTSYKYFINNADLFETIIKKTNTLLCIDEAHLELCKKSNHLYLAVDRMCKSTDMSLLLLSATPLQNSLEDCYNIAELLSPSLLGESVADFKETYEKPIISDLERGNKRQMCLLRSLSSLFCHAKDAFSVHSTLPKKSEFCLGVAVKDIIPSDLNSESYRNPIGTYNKIHDLIRPNKCTVVISLVESIRERCEGESILILSQRKQILSEIVSHVDNAFMLHGALKPELRVQVLADFKHAASTKSAVLCMTKEVGMTGLHLPEASHVILVEPHWNPVMDNQSVGRMYRLGQTRESFVYRLMANATIEEHMYMVSLSKGKLISTHSGGDVLSTSLSSMPALMDCEDSLPLAVQDCIKYDSNIDGVRLHDSGALSEVDVSIDMITKYERAVLHNDYAKVIWRVYEKPKWTSSYLATPHSLCDHVPFWTHYTIEGLFVSVIFDLKPYCFLAQPTSSYSSARGLTVMKQTLTCQSGTSEL